MKAESSKQGSLELRDNVTAITEHTWVYARSSTYILWLLDVIFVGFLTLVLGLSLTLLPVLDNPFLLLGCLL